MWTPITDCGKQLRINAKIREQVDNSFLIYKLVEVEFDQYKFELINRNNLPVTEKLHNILDCSQITRYHFEVEDSTPIV